MTFTRYLVIYPIFLFYINNESQISKYNSDLRKSSYTGTTIYNRFVSIDNRCGRWIKNFQKV